MTQIDKINAGKFDFPIWKLKTPGSMITRYQKVCTECAVKILSEKDLIAHPDCMAADRNGNVLQSAVIIPEDYVIFDFISGKFKSVFNGEINCSICKTIIKR